MYAFVQFLVDKVKAIVPVRDIKNFDSNCLESDFSGVYEVFWKSANGEGTGYWFAVVLLVAETEELIEQRKKRVKLPSPKKLEELLAITVNSKNSMVDEETRQKTKEIEDKRSACEKDKLREILRRKLKEDKKKSTTFSDEDRDGVSVERFKKNPKRSRKDLSLSDSSEGDDLVPKSELTRISMELSKVLRKLKLRNDEIVHLRKRNEQLHELNINLQSQLLKFLNTNGNLKLNSAPAISCKLPEFSKETLNEVKAPQKTVNKGKTPLETLNKGETPQEMTNFPTETPPAQTIEGNSSLPTQSSTALYLHDSGSLMKWEDEKMELAPGVTISKDQWGKIVRGKNMNVSRIGRNLAVTLWGSERLVERSVTGFACKRYLKNGVEAKAPLTPMKVDAVQNGLRFWLKENEKMKEEDVIKLTSVAAVRKILSNKIMDLVKQKKILSNALT